MKKAEIIVDLIDKNLPIPEALDVKIKEGLQNIKDGEVHSFEYRPNHFLTQTYVKSFKELKNDANSLAVKILMNIHSISTKNLKKHPEQDYFIITFDTISSNLFVAYKVTHELPESLYEIIAIHSEPKENAPTFH